MELRSFLKIEHTRICYFYIAVEIREEKRANSRSGVDYIKMDRPVGMEGSQKVPLNLKPFPPPARQTHPDGLGAYVPIFHHFFFNILRRVVEQPPERFSYI